MSEMIPDLAELRERVREALPGITDIRRELHRHPEPSLEERETARRIRGWLEGLPLERLPSYLETDTVLLLRGGRPRPNVTLRADIDALPVEEGTGRPWRSQTSGRAHACGHDGHTAMLIGAARVLSPLAERLPGSVRFVFQPGEEELGGGKTMVAGGLLEAEPRADAVFALHGWPELPVGSVGAAPGPIMAAADRFRITVTGKGGHGARPHVAVDPVVTAAQVIMALQTVVSRTVDPVQAAVVSVCAVRGGHTSNVIPQEVVLEGTTRYFQRGLKEVIRTRIEEIGAGVCAAAGARFNLEYRPGYIPTVNDARMTSFARSVVREAIGEAAWVDDIPPTMGAEDFSFYLDRVPGVFLRLGLGRDHPHLHSPEFDFEDGALETGIMTLCSLAVSTLARGVPAA